MHTPILPPALLLLATACGPEPDHAAVQGSPMTEPGGDTGDTSQTSTTADTLDTSTSGPASASTSGSAADTTQPATASTTADPPDATGATTGPASVCGDGVVDGDEECDDPDQPTCFNCTWDRLVFVTSTQNYVGDFAAHADKDYYCNHLAAVAGLLTDPKKRFRAWVSTTTQSPADRLYHSPGRYVLRNGLVFAQSWDALVAGEILNPLNVDENSETHNAAVWTDTRPDGTPMPGNHCEDWTSPNFEKFAYLGDSTAITGDWTLSTGRATNPVDCLFTAALYCFESP